MTAETTSCGRWRWAQSDRTTPPGSSSSAAFSRASPSCRLSTPSVVDPDGTAESDRRRAVDVDHVAYTNATLTDLLENYAELKAKGVTPYWCVHHGLAASLYYADPDANQMEFQVDAFAGDGCNDFIRGAQMARNPVGVEFDADDWLARLRGGAP